MNANLVRFVSKKITRRLDDVLDAETCSVQHTRSGGLFLNSFLKELGLNRDSNLLIFNDNKSLCSHIQTTNVHKNPRLNVIWSSLRDDYTNNNISLRWICGKWRNISDILTKVKSSLLEAFYRSVQVGKVLIPV